MDDVIDTLKEKCVNEFIINNLHCLLHADDTLIMSLDFALFIHKCNVLVKCFGEKKLLLNISKSAYMAINPPSGFLKTNVKIEGGWLPYCSSVVYLGVIVSDNGLLSTDVILQVQSKFKSVSVKFANYITNNIFAPITVKLKVLQTCVNSALLYSCETWGPSSLVKLETIHRNAIRIALSLRRTTPNDILHTESGLEPLKGTIYKRQYNFWSKIMKDIEERPNSPISVVYQQAIACKLPFVKHYMMLHEEFSDANDCLSYHTDVKKASSRESNHEKSK